MSPTAPRRVASWLVMAAILTTQLMLVLDSTIVNVALPHIQSALGLQPHRAVLGDQRLHARLRRAPAARCASRRPARPSARAARRDRRLRARLDPRWLRADLRRAARRPRGPRGRRRLRRAVGAGPARREVPPGGRARPRAGLVRCRLDRRGRRRPARRRCADPVGVVALGLLRQRPDRAGPAGGQPPGPRRDPTPPRAVRPGRRVHRDDRHDGPGLRLRAGRVRRVDRPGHRGRVRRRRRAAQPVRRRRAARGLADHAARAVPAPHAVGRSARPGAAGRGDDGDVLLPHPVPPGRARVRADGDGSGVPAADRDGLRDVPGLVDPDDPDRHAGPDGRWLCCLVDGAPAALAAASPTAGTSPCSCR